MDSECIRPTTRQSTLPKPIAVSKKLFMFAIAKQAGSMLIDFKSSFQYTNQQMKLKYKNASTIFTY